MIKHRLTAHQRYNRSRSFVSRDFRARFSIGSLHSPICAHPTVSAIQDFFPFRTVAAFSQFPSTVSRIVGRYSDTLFSCLWPTTSDHSDFCPSLVLLIFPTDIFFSFYLFSRCAGRSVSFDFRSSSLKHILVSPIFLLID